MNAPLSGVEVDTETAIAELEALVAALKAKDAYIQSISHEEQAAVEDTSTETVSVKYVLTDEFDGIDPIQYERGEGN